MDVDTASTTSIPPRRERSTYQAKEEDISTVLADMVRPEPKVEGMPKELQLLSLFQGSSANAIVTSLINFMKEETGAGDAVILRVIAQERFRLHSMNPKQDSQTFDKNDLKGLLEVLATQNCSALEEEVGLEDWGAVFPKVPRKVVLLPIPKPKPYSGVSESTDAIACLALFSAEVPPPLTEVDTILTVVSACKLIIPLLSNTIHHDEVKRKFQTVDKAMQVVTNCQKEYEDIYGFTKTLGFEVRSFFGVDSCVVFAVYIGEENHETQLLKYSSDGGGMISQTCPNKLIHKSEQFPAEKSTPAGYAALCNKTVRINTKDDWKHYCRSDGPIHTVGGCMVKNVMCFCIDDAANEMPLVVELSNKQGGFTEKDFIEASKLARMLSPVHSTAVMMDYKKRSVNRVDITNELINNIKTVEFRNVKHMLDLQFRYTGMFRRSFFTFRYVFKNLKEGQFSGIVLYMFNDLGFIDRWKIKRAALIRFILTIEQGYRENPYHNWKHACTVAHFCFTLLKKYEILKEGYLREVEAFALFVACLCHDIDHRGVNSHFSLCMEKKDPNNVHVQEDGLMERHHVAVTLQILAAEDCNIIENLTDQEYNDFIELVSSNILATDVTKYLYDQNNQLSKINRFDKTSAENRRVLMTVLMTACDLSETIKPWEDYIVTVRSVFAEFFNQGEQEMKLGFFPAPIMDRRIAYIPYIEMKFLNEIVRPVFVMLTKIIPRTAECLKTIDYYKDLWLVATQVFDDHAHIEDPLQILDLPQMKEENLKAVRNPLLGKEAFKIRKSLVIPPPKLSSDSNVEASGSNAEASGSNVEASGSKSATDVLETTSIEEVGSVSASEEEEEETRNPDNPEEVPVKVPMKEKVGHCFKCFFSCKRQSLRDAALIRKTKRENAFMEERCSSYEAKRSEGIDMEEGPQGPLRERSHSVDYPAACRESILRTSIKGYKERACQRQRAKRNKGNTKPSEEQKKVSSPLASSPEITETVERK